MVAPLGCNGAGKSIPLKSLTGMATPRTGWVTLDVVELAGKKSHVIARAACSWCTKRGACSAAWTQRENLASLTAPNKWPLDRVYEMSPGLKGRRTSASTSSTTDTSCTKATEAIKAQPRILRRYLGL